PDTTAESDDRSREYPEFQWPSRDQDSDARRIPHMASEHFILEIRCGVGFLFSTDGRAISDVHDAVDAFASGVETAVHAPALACCVPISDIEGRHCNQYERGFKKGACCGRLERKLRCALRRRANTGENSTVEFICRAD